MEENERARLHAIVEGRVQGVGFRAFVIDKAVALGVTGWVRNRWDGTVEVMAEAGRPALDKFLGALRNGPPAARVTQVKTTWQSPTGEFRGFNFKSTV